MNNQFWSWIWFIIVIGLYLLGAWVLWILANKFIALFVGTTQKIVAGVIIAIAFVIVLALMLGGLHLPLPRYPWG